MRLATLYVRFFRSFNYDYDRKAHPNAEPEPWEYIDGAWFPFVRVPLEPDVTAVVGANESGKSHLVGAILRALTGNDIDRKDFCRYSELLSVEEGTMRAPDFGLEVEVVDDADKEMAVALGVASDRMTFVRLGTGESLLMDGAADPRVLEPDEVAQVEAALPKPVELETNVPIPDSLSFDTLIVRDPTPLAERGSRFALVDVLRRMSGTETSDIEAQAGEIAAVLSQSPAVDAELERKRQISEDLGRRLLTEVAQIAPAAFGELEAAIRDGESGRAAGLLQKMNDHLARHLNFPRWWRQDKDFQLRLKDSEREVALIIRDRTGTDYSFSERSRGLMYFLSYYVQLRVHTHSSERPEVLLMDEPDAYLSSLGQQDLLRTLESFARPDNGSRRDQVVYVTHSPFLINKNYGHRIRVLDKSASEEGTRVVRSVSRTHYEPLRSSIGTFLAETAFIGGANLLVEGLADQVLLAGITGLLRGREIPRRRLLDLNEMTIVPAGGADSVPYMAFLARGRDQRKPACVALLDGDTGGRNAAAKLRSSEADGQRVLEDSNIVVLDQWMRDNPVELDGGIKGVEIEDLVPASLAAVAANAYADRLWPLSEAHPRIDAAGILSKVTKTKPALWPAVEKAFAETYDSGHIDKVGFAKELIIHLDRTRGDANRPPGGPQLEHNFALLLADLTERLQLAQEAEVENRHTKQLDRIIDAFLRDFPDGVERDTAERRLRDIENKLGDSEGDQAVRATVSVLRREFSLRTDPLEQVPDYASFKERLSKLPLLARLAYDDPAAP